MKVLLCLLLFIGSAVARPPFFADETRELIRRGQNALFNDDWDSARAIFREMEKADSSDPGAILFSAATLQAEMMDAEEDLFGHKFLNMLTRVKTVAEENLKVSSRRDSALNYFYLGHQYAYRSLYEARFGSNLSAFSQGLKAKGCYQRGLAADSTLYDLYLGLGSYHYWKSAKAGLLRTFGFFKDDRERGLREIQLAADSAFISRDAAVAALIWIMINEKNYDSAASLGQTMLAKFPDGKTFLWPLAEAYFKGGQYGRAAAIYDTLLKKLKESPGNYFNIIEVSYWLDRCFEKTGNLADRKELRHYIDSISNQISREMKRKQKNRLAYLQHGD